MTATARLPYAREPIKLISIRSLTTADIEFINSGPKALPMVKVLRERHHRIAWLIALGKTVSETAAEVKCSPTRISMHKASPAFMELVARYKREIDERRIADAAEFHETAARTMTLGERVIQREVQKLVDDPEAKADLRTINRIVADRMDRFGYGKHTTSESKNVNINFASKLEAAISRSRKVLELP